MDDGGCVTRETGVGEVVVHREERHDHTRYKCCSPVATWHGWVISPVKTHLIAGACQLMVAKQTGSVLS
jgi:hypothetical protein